MQDCEVLAKYYDPAAAAACKPALGVMTEPNGGNTPLVSTPTLPGCNLLCKSGIHIGQAQPCS